MVETNHPDRNSDFTMPDEDWKAIALHLLEFLRHEVKVGRMPPQLLPLQSGVGNGANAELAGLDGSEFTDLVAFTEVIPYGMLDLIDSGTLRAASATSFGPSSTGVERFMSNIDAYKGRILLRSEEISNHPALVRRLGVIAMNGMLEADIYGNVNSTHVMGSAIMNGIGGSGDFTRNAFLKFLPVPVRRPRAVPSPRSFRWSATSTTPSTTCRSSSPNKDWPTFAVSRPPTARPASSRIVPTLTSATVTTTCVAGAQAARSQARHIPHLLDEALSWHQSFLDTGRM